MARETVPGTYTRSKMGKDKMMKKNPQRHMQYFSVYSPFEYGGEHRDIAYRIKDPKDKEALRYAAEEMSELIDDDAVLIPAPPSSGGRDGVYTLAKEIQKIVPGSVVVEAIQRIRPVKSMVEAKRAGLPGLSLEEHSRSLGLVKDLPEGPIYLIDNVITTGNTIKAMANLLWDAKLIHPFNMLGFKAFPLAGVVYADARKYYKKAVKNPMSQYTISPKFGDDSYGPHVKFLIPDFEYFDHIPTNELERIINDAYASRESQEVLDFLEIIWDERVSASDPGAYEEIELDQVSWEPGIELMLIQAYSDYASGQYTMFDKKSMIQNVRSTVEDFHGSHDHLSDEEVFETVKGLYEHRQDIVRRYKMRAINATKREWK
jgi:predicted amidophosphoribosyltransferase